MITELIITDKDVRGKYRNHKYSQYGIVKEVLKILSDNKLLIQTKKCHFHQTKIDYLGVIISKNSIEVDSIKIKGVAE